MLSEKKYNTMLSENNHNKNFSKRVVWESLNNWRPKLFKESFVLEQHELIEHKAICYTLCIHKPNILSKN